MKHPSLPPNPALGIERVTRIETITIAQVDILTRNPVHALILESLFGVHPFRLARRGETLHAFPRLPAARARAWLATQGVEFAVRPGALAPGGPETWVQGGFAPAP